MKSQAKIPATIVTGFLGAGKTTLLRHVLENANGRRIALIINEFGDVGIDGEILKGCGIESCNEDTVVELANGCLCCTVADDFVPAIDALLGLDEVPDHIIVETSGLALPKPLVKAFNWPEIRSRLTVDGVVAVVDGPAVAEGRFAHDPVALEAQAKQDQTLDHDNPLEEVYEDQLLCADLVVMTKTDLLEPEQIETVSRGISKILPRAVQVFKTAQGRIDPEILLGLSAAAEDDLDSRPSHHDHEGEHDHEDFDSFVVTCGPIEDPGHFISSLKILAQDHDILRIKGFLPVDGKAMRLLIQGVGNRFDHHFDRPWKPGEAKVGRIVIIGQHGIDQAAIQEAIQEASQSRTLEMA